jgi:hypothetical protein
MAEIYICLEIVRHLAAVAKIFASGSNSRNLHNNFYLKSHISLKFLSFLSFFKFDFLFPKADKLVEALRRPEFPVAAV